MQGKLISSITALAGVAAAAPSTQHKARATEWQATSVNTYYTGHGIAGGASFDLSAPAGYILDAPAFDVRCDAGYAYGTGVAEGTACTFKSGSAQPRYSVVKASVNYNTLTVDVSHQWLAGNSYRKVSSAAGVLSERPLATNLPDFTVTLSDAVSQVPGLIGDFGTWAATEGDFVRDSQGRNRGMQYKLSAPAGYAPDAPAFDVSCYYDYNSDASVFPECTPVGDVAADSKVSLWASVLYNITTVHHEWTAADGTSYQLVGTSDALPGLGAQTTEFSIKPDVLNTL